MTRLRVILPVLMAALAGIAIAAQSPAPGDALSFEAASIKPNRSGESRRGFRIEPGGNVTASNITLRHLMWQAYQVHDFQIIGGPSWAGTDRYDVVARAGVNPRPEQLRLMLRGLLANRFRLKVRTTTRDLPIYALVMAGTDGRTGPRLRAAEGACAEPVDPAVPGGPGCGATVANGTLRTAGISMARLTGELTGFVGRRVVDRTGLAGNFAIELDWSPELQAGPAQPGEPAGDARPSLFTAVQEQLGLRLEPRTGPVPVIVIESVERPSED